MSHDQPSTLPRSDLALYVHWPFCIAKCPYCDFNSHVRRAIDEEHWFDALFIDLAFEHMVNAGRRIGSIFFGGGTPSLMPPALVAALIKRADALWGLTDDCEITLEANPSSVEAARFGALAKAGVNRVSIGLQSFDDAALRFLGRLHDAAEGVAALEVAQRHFRRVSFDLIYALPGQEEGAWRAELTRALGFGTGHLSLYQLTIEPGTRFATLVREGRFAPLADDPAADLFAMTQEMAAQAGLPAYEISNHARPGERSRHNLAYWHYADYLGIGPGAHGRRGGVATLRHKKPENYLAAVARQHHGIAEERPLGRNEQASEALLMGLRLADGIDLAALSRRFAIPVDEMIDGPRVDFHERLGLVLRDGDRLRVTGAGMPVLDALLTELVPAALVTA